jgi:hypothetical protein
MNLRNRDCCSELFENLKILPSYSQYIFSLLLLFVVKNININQIKCFIALTLAIALTFALQYKM